jgi:hypothetical protein
MKLNETGGIEEDVTSNYEILRMEHPVYARIA